MIYCIWYPSGGYGHFINYVISYHGKNFCHVPHQFTLSADGNSHRMPLILPKYQRLAEDEYHLPEIDPDRNYTLLIDNGINDESMDFAGRFAGSRIIKICYDDYSWPVIAHTHIIKAMKSDLGTEIKPEDHLWPVYQDWVQREKNFLYLRDHALRKKWRHNVQTLTLNLDQLRSYDKLRDSIVSFGIELQDFSAVWMQWWKKNKIYFDPVIQAQRVIASLDQEQTLDLTHITDTWTQSVIYYYIWLYFQREVLHNDFSDFFSDSKQIRTWLQTLKY